MKFPLGPAMSSGRSPFALFDNTERKVRNRSTEAAVWLVRCFPQSSIKRQLQPFPQIAGRLLPQSW